MALVITWNDGTNPPSTFTFSDSVVVALEAYRLTFKTANPLTGAQVPIYPTLQEFVVGMLAQRTVAQAFEISPPAEVSSLKSAVDTAQEAYAVGKAMALMNAVTIS